MYAVKKPLRYKFKYLRQILKLIDLEGINLMVAKTPIPKLKYDELCLYIYQLEREKCIEFSFLNPRLANHLTDKGRQLMRISEDYKLIVKMRKRLAEYETLTSDTIISVASYVTVFE